MNMGFQTTETETFSFFEFSFYLVYQVFENVAEKYDVMNDAMSLGIHRLWKDMLLRAMHPQPGAQLLDVAGGTGKSQHVHLCLQRRNGVSYFMSVIVIFRGHCLSFP